MNWIPMCEMKPEFKDGRKLLVIQCERVSSEPFRWFEAYWDSRHETWKRPKGGRIRERDLSYFMLIDLPFELKEK